MPNYYHTKTTANGVYKTKGSKFIAYLDPCFDETQADLLRKNYRDQFHDARHVCFAYRLLNGQNVLERFNDDGEPSGTAGRPILGQLIKNSLVNNMITVIRYFGGTKLGTGGLITAYRFSCEEAIFAATLSPWLHLVDVTISTTYDQVDRLLKLIIAMEGIVVAKDFGEKCELIFRLPKNNIATFQNSLNSKTQIKQI